MVSGSAPLFVRALPNNGSTKSTIHSQRLGLRFACRRLASSGVQPVNERSEVRGWKLEIRGEKGGMRCGKWGKSRVSGSRRFEE
jgi:hypothetical protein